MTNPLIRAETPIEYFRELVEGAVERQRVESEELTRFYVVNLLAGFVQLDEGKPFDSEPLSLQLGRALQSGGATQRAGLRQVGDASLFISGFFSESLNRRLVDLDYYISLGGYAYEELSRQESQRVSRIFAELAEKFTAFVDVLSEVSERSGISSNNDLLRLYEKWIRTGSRRDGELLIERGILPNASIPQRFLQ
ncbi:MAG: hypothetical protein HY654_02495 [Acidobacteria bacterium]|nr:hypothetical protein [Acidobacteriota bacterium]